jgi:multiple sugar transport system substrate-binding protein
MRIGKKWAFVILGVCVGTFCAGAVMAQTKIEYYHINTATFGGPTVAKLVKDFNEKQKAYVASEKFQAGAYGGLTTALQVAAAAGRPPAVAQISYRLLRYAAETFGPTPIDRVAGGEFQAVADTYHPSVLKLGQLKGVQWGMPYALSSAVMYLNPELFKTAGLDPNAPPRTWEDVVQAARTIKDKTGKFGLYIQMDDTWPMTWFLYGLGGQWLSEDGERAQVNTPKAIKGMEFWASLVKDGLHPMAKNDEGFPSFQAGNIGMVFTTIARRDLFESGSKFPVKVGELPGFAGQPRKIAAGGNILMMFAKDPQEKAGAWALIKHLVSPQGITEWVKGTGYISSLKDLEKDSRYLGNLFVELPNMRPPYAQVQYVVPEENWPKKGLQIEQILIETRDAILLGQVDAKTGMDRAQAKVEQAMR